MATVVQCLAVPACVCARGRNEASSIVQSVVYGVDKVHDINFLRRGDPPSKSSHCRIPVTTPHL
ncbi:hypothetical protein E2C01_094200 [Portunus trituberculatus]|uniref:Uncharacterized protein n=1 Tax=Portunus trituberculatus TaxID=210409 RepID=A0A5B7K063_PORTR|nr:hypothetical protein [Portunus trituberculatus]